ncbi:MAG: hypothetical protein ACREFQ_04525 [Stellaceae bacterium]
MVASLPENRQWWDYPRKRQDIVPKYPQGCLSYSANPPITAEFSGTRAEEALASQQNQNGCAGLDGHATPVTGGSAVVVGQALPRAVKLTSMSLPLSAFFSSDPARPHETLLEFKGLAVLEQNGDASYSADVRYKVTRLSGRPDGNPASVRIRPMFTGISERLYPYFTKAYPDGFVRLGPDSARDTGSAEGRMQFAVSDGKEWVFAPAEFAFVDRDNRVLAEMEIPAFVPFASSH